MGKIIDLLFKEKNISGEITADYGSLDKIRNDIIDAIYIFSTIVGTFAIYGTIMRIGRFGWQPAYIYNFFLYAFILSIIFLRKKISLNWKAFIFFTVFFILASTINYTNGIVSGALIFVFITTLVTLLFGWKMGVATIVVTTIVRTIIGMLFYTGELHYSIDLWTYINSLPALITGIAGGFVIASIIVFAINKFYKWLMFSLQTVSVKINELEQVNKELIHAKEKAEEHDRLKSVFLANMSHEIRTPMNAIVGFSELLSKPNLTDEQKIRFISLVQDRSYDLMRIIEDILDISKIEVNQMNLIDVEFNLESLLNEINEYYRLKMEKTHNLSYIDFECVIPPTIKNLTVSMDNQRLKQILTNLLDNAFKFTSKGKIEFGCRLEGSTLNFWVKDTGIGILQSKQFVIFDHFRQAEESVGSRQYGGTGLGLSIVQGIIKLMNGRIWLESEVGKGSTFFFTIPVRVLDKKKSENTGNANLQVDWTGKNILIVEDDFANSEFLRELLSDSNANLFFARNGRDALEQVRSNHQIELVLMDIRLPDINGFKLTEEVKKEFPEKIIIAQTAYAGSSDAKKCMEAGCDEFITKPIQQAQLLSLLNKYLSAAG